MTNLNGRISGISYLLKNGQSGTITDPLALRIFYLRLFKRRHEEEIRRSARRHFQPEIK
jgi:hypothetical protein